MFSFCSSAPPDQPHIDGAPVISVVVDTPYDIVCRADNGKPAANVTWSSNGEQITQNVSYSFTTKPDGKRQDAVGTLTITPQKSDQARSIRCDVRNSAMNFPKWTEAHLEVLCKCCSIAIEKGEITRNALEKSLKCKV